MNGENNYKIFKGFVEGRLTDTLPDNEEISATPEEVGFWKRFQFERAKGRAIRDEATLVELRYLRKKR